MESDKGFAVTYMLLNPEQVTFIGLIGFLFSGDLTNRKFIRSSEEKEKSLPRRWIIFLSLIIQKILKLISKPLAFLGCIIEKCLNIFTANGNLLKLLFNIIRGKVLVPDKSSASFASIMGHLDFRKALDKRIKHRDANYFAALSMMASKVAYENESYVQAVLMDYWKMEDLGFYNYWNDYQKKASTQAFVFNDKTDDKHQTIVISFRGTEPFNADDWCSDFDISWFKFPKIGKVHAGFLKALGLENPFDHSPKYFSEQKDAPPSPFAYYHLRDLLKRLLTGNENAKFVVTGHSLGAALATLFMAVLIIQEEAELLERLEGVYTFGQPRVGDEEFGQFMESKMKEYGVRYIRIVYCYDLVPRVPFDDKELMFKDFGTCVYYDRRYTGKVVSVLPYKNYFSLFGIIPKMINAVFELIRSFTIVWSNGAEYREGWLMRAFRVIGPLMPGIINHFPQDYVNATRLGPPDTFASPNETSIHQVIIHVKGA